MISNGNRREPSKARDGVFIIGKTDASIVPVFEPPMLLLTSAFIRTRRSDSLHLQFLHGRFQFLPFRIRNVQSPQRYLLRPLNH